MSSLPYRIFIDESERDQYFVLGAVLIAEDNIQVLKADWRALQHRILQKLLEDKPSLADAPYFKAGHLPEIHAKDLMNSHKYYTLAGEHYYPNYYERQIQWLREAHQIILQHPVQFLVHDMQNLKTVFDIKDQFMHVLQKIFAGSTTEHGQDVLEYFQQMLQNLWAKIPPKKRKRAISLTQNKYLHAFPLFLGCLNDVLEQLDTTAQVFCDTYESVHHFSLPHHLRILQDHGHMMRLQSPPEFLHSHEHVMLQVADVLSYTYCTQMAPGKSTKGHIMEDLFNAYLQPGLDKGQYQRVKGSTHSLHADSMHTLLLILEELSLPDEIHLQLMGGVQFFLQMPDLANVFESIEDNPIFEQVVLFSEETPE